MLGTIEIGTIEIGTIEIEMREIGTGVRLGRARWSF
jgi:hypothetical protein